MVDVSCDNVLSNYAELFVARWLGVSMVMKYHLHTFLCHRYIVDCYTMKFIFELIISTYPNCSLLLPLLKGQKDKSIIHIVHL